MNLNKEINIIKNNLLEMQKCKNVERFYQLCTSLYFHINCIVFNFQHTNIEIKNTDYKNEVSNNYSFDSFLR